jgi:tungstate transport system substrate-binding protein
MAMQLEEWLLSDKSAALINTYQINGETLFVFNGQQ